MGLVLHLQSTLDAIVDNLALLSVFNFKSKRALPIYQSGSVLMQDFILLKCLAGGGGGLTTCFVATISATISR